MKLVVFFIIIIFGVAGLEPLTKVTAEILDTSKDDNNSVIQEYDGEKSEDGWSFHSLLLPFIAGIIFALSLYTILIAQKKLENIC